LDYYLDHLARESTRFGQVLHDAQSGLRVPTCPDWDTEDLLWHLAQVQWFWGTVVRDGLTGPQVDELIPDRPGERPALEQFFQQASQELGRVLAATDPRASAWTWSTEQTAGFTRRRQAHEALIHRIDAELLADRRTAMDPALCTDGVDEALRIMYGGTPPWGHFVPEARKSLRISTVDTSASWFVELGRFYGTDPDDGTSYDQPDLRVALRDPGTAVTATISGRAEDLDCWLWHRPTIQPLTRSGNDEIHAEFNSIIAPGIS
jgi:uncharacterized protein (TIGR03083 family)